MPLRVKPQRSTTTTSTRRWVGLVVLAALLGLRQHTVRRRPAPSLLSKYNNNINRNSDSKGDADPQAPFDLEGYLETFVAANPAYTEDCKAYLRSPADYNAERESFINWKWHFSQYNQDWFIFVNFFYAMAQHNQTGFYVESGANDAIRVSNTALFDHCLGWRGLCIEPSGRYHAKIRAERSCELVTNCLSNVEGEVIKIANEVPGGTTGTEITCRRLDHLLAERDISHVDLWSLDIEGFEFKALQGVDWSAASRLQIQSILMEQQDITQGVCAQMPMDYRLTTLGYRKYRLVSDGFYYRETRGLQFPSVDLLDGYFHGLEDKRCQDQQGRVDFFTDPTSPSV
jgi:hypothetical protein